MDSTAHRPLSRLVLNPHLEGDSFHWQAGSDGILLIHGFTATSAEVRPLARRLHSAGFTVAGPLLPGHNTHPADLNQVKWKDWVDCVDASYHQLRENCARVVVGGESMGALLALHLAACRPEISALLLYAPALKLNLNRKILLRLRLNSLFRPWVDKANLDGNPLWQGYSVNPLKGTLQLIALQRKVRAELGKIKQPILIMQGRFDPAVHPDVPELIMRGTRSEIHEMHWLEESTHCVVLQDEFEIIVEQTVQFLQRVLNEK